MVKDFPGHVIDLVCHKITVSLCDIAKGTAFFKEAADYAVISLVTATLTACVGMAVVDGQPLVSVFVLLHALTVGKFGAVIHGNGLECFGGELLYDGAQSRYSGLCGFAEDTEDNFITGQAFRQNEDAFMFAFGLAYYTVKLPVPEGGTGVYFLRAVFYAGSFGWSFSLYVAVFAPFIGLFSQVFIANIGDIAIVYVAGYGGGGTGADLLGRCRQGRGERGDHCIQQCRGSWNCNADGRLRLPRCAGSTYQRRQRQPDRQPGDPAGNDPAHQPDP